MTLVEVIAALVVLGTIVSLLSVARSRSLTSEAAASQSLRASRRVDQLLAGWFESGGGVPVDASGDLDADPPRLLWSTGLLVDPEAQRLGAQVVRLSVFAQTRPGRPVLEIDLLAGLPRPAGERSADGPGLGGDSPAADVAPADSGVASPFSDRSSGAGGVDSSPGTGDPAMSAELDSDPSTSQPAVADPRSFEDPRLDVEMLAP